MRKPEQNIPSPPHTLEPVATPELSEPELTPEQIEAAAAMARLEDRSGAFTSVTLAADLLELRDIYHGTFERTRDEDWLRRLGRNAEGWTRREALAYVEAMTHTYHLAILATLGGAPLIIPGLNDIDELSTFARQQIEARAEATEAELIASLETAFSEIARIVGQLGPEELGRTQAVPWMTSVPTVAELAGAVLANAGVLYGLHLALARSRPTWLYFSPGMMRRQMTRLIHLIGLSYRSNQGGELYATIGLNIAGQGGGSWFVRISPEGGMGKIGLARTTDVTLEIASADLFCRLVLGQASSWQHWLRRTLRIKGNLRLARRLPALLIPG
ncbi:SCP2 sterol-binding domain-containing protein [Candidatus Chloroploca sp. Khr17]|uniref:SCP2 sterol-binding domain-containing protein n=1 Tax=Candidatus Chloroploca sp. Khr17 TaxID=2496869 RepID=UPI00101CC8B8|nr:SCP2 sterol-binding domain-containing protein [Candidatus Chloroploca sp. Khr17]